MHELTKVLITTALAGLAIPIGGFGAHFENMCRGKVRDIFLHAVIAFGGGALLAAVALVLVPEGIHALPLAWNAPVFLAGGIVFLLVDRFLERSGTQASQLIAMVMDFVPEALALGAACGTGSDVGYVLAILIGLQNLPEGFNSFRELRKSGIVSRVILVTMVLLALLGPAAGVTGLYLLVGRPEIVGGVMLFAGGGITYLIFQDIAPASRLGEHWSPTLGGVLGFLAGMIGHQLIM